MLNIECPICTAEAETDDALSVITCGGCGLQEEIAPTFDDLVAIAA